MIVVDSSVWIDYFNGRITPQTDRLDALLGKEEILIGDLILTEVLQGFRREADFQQAVELFAALEYRDMVGRDVAAASSRNYRFLRERGVTVRKTVDVIIGTFCLTAGYPLLHADRDFGPMVAHLGLQTVIA